MSKKKSLQSLPSKVDKYEKLKKLSLPHEPHQVKMMALEMIDSKGDEELDNSSDSPIIRAISLREFDNGMLMTLGLHDVYKTFAIQMSLDLQKQYDCQAVGKKSLAEVASLNYCRVMSVQRQMKTFFEKDSYGDLTVKILSMFSKELDRAQRHYLTAIQELEMSVRPPYKLQIKTQTANIANQQAIQQVGEQINVKAK